MCTAVGTGTGFCCAWPAPRSGSWLTEQHEGIVELNFESSEPLDQVEERLRGAGVTITRPTRDEGFGRQLQLASPDGLLVKIDELQPELYT